MEKSFLNSLISIAYLVRALSSLPSSRRFSYKGKKLGTVNILGTGPSLKDDFSALLKKCNNESYFALNDFGTSELFEKIRPQYYILLDPSYWVPHDKCNERDYQLREILFERFNTVLSWNMILFVPWKAIKSNYFSTRITNKNITIVPINYLNFYPTYSKFYLYILKKNLGVVPVGNVMGGAIYLAINMGFKRINIYGADHSWTKDLRVNDQNQVCTIKKHFFEENEVLEPWRKTNKEIFRMSEVLKMLQSHFYGYEYLNWFANSVGCKIVNKTKGSFIDSFDRE